MGASGWNHFVPYEPDIARALEQLRESVFRGGTFYAPRSAKKSKTIEALLQRCGEEGTHSALDVHRVADTPFPMPVLKWYSESIEKTGAAPPPEVFQKRMLDEARLAGTVGPLSEEDLQKLFGTKKPTRADVERGFFAVFPLIPRGCGVYVVVYDASGAPSEILFQGKTGD